MGVGILPATFPMPRTLTVKCGLSACSWHLLEVCLNRRIMDPDQDLLN